MIMEPHIQWKVSWTKVVKTRMLDSDNWDRTKISKRVVIQRFSARFLQQTNLRQGKVCCLVDID